MEDCVECAKEFAERLAMELHVPGKHYNRALAVSVVTNTMCLVFKYFAKYSRNTVLVRLRLSMCFCWTTCCGVAVDFRFAVDLSYSVLYKWSLGLKQLALSVDFWSNVL